MFNEFAIHLFLDKSVTVRIGVTVAIAVGGVAIPIVGITAISNVWGVVHILRGVGRGIVIAIVVAIGVAIDTTIAVVISGGHDRYGGG